MKIKNICLMMVFFLGGVSFLNAESLSLEVEVSTSSEFERIDREEALAEGWQTSDDDLWTLDMQNVEISERRGVVKKLGGVALRVWKNVEGEIYAKISYSDHDNGSGAAVLLHKNVLNKFEASGADNSTWSFHGSAELRIVD